MKKKQLLLSLLVIVLMLSLVACRSKAPVDTTVDTTVDGSGDVSGDIGGIDIGGDVGGDDIGGGDVGGDDIGGGDVGGDDIGGEDVGGDDIGGGDVGGDDIGGEDVGGDDIGGGDVGGDDIGGGDVGGDDIGGGDVGGDDIGGGDVGGDDIGGGDVGGDDIGGDDVGGDDVGGDDVGGGDVGGGDVGGDDIGGGDVGGGDVGGGDVGGGDVGGGDVGGGDVGGGDVGGGDVGGGDVGGGDVGGGDVGGGDVGGGDVGGGDVGGGDVGGGDVGGDDIGGGDVGGDDIGGGDTADAPLNGYVVDELKIGGIDISKYVIVKGKDLTPDELNVVNKLKEQIKRICGADIQIVSNSKAPVEYEILVGNTNRAESSAKLEVGYATVKQQGSKIVLYGNGEYANLYALEIFIQDILGSVPSKRVYDIEMPVYDNVKYVNPNLAGTNMPLVLTDYKAEKTYDPDFKNNDNVLERFYKSVSEFPEKVTVLDRYSPEDFPLSMQTQLFVAPDGNDKNAGTIDAPLATIEAALEKVKTSYGAVIWLRGGVYSDKVTIKNVEGTAVSPVIISAYKDEKPIFTAGKSLSPSDFAPVDYSKDKVAQRIPEKAKENVVCVNLKELGWTDEDIGAISSAGLPKFYINSKITNIARYPNAGETELFFEYVYDTGSVTAGPIHSDLYEGWIKRVQSGEFDKNPDVTFYTDNHGNRNLDWGWAIRMIDLTPFRWVNTGNIWYCGNIFEGWETGIYNIKSFDIRTQKLTSKTGSTYGAKHSTNSPTRHNNFYYFNVIEALDTPGEWFYDVDTGNMYVYKTEGFENAQLFYATKTEDDIFYVTTCKNMIFNGISIDISGRYGMNIISSDGIIVQGCEIKNTASYGIVVGYKTVNSAVTYCDFSSTGSAMIYAQTTAYPQGTLLPTRFVIQNNYLHDPMENNHTGITAGGYLSVVSHNRLEDCNINISNASECIVEYNDVSGGSRTVSDGGLIYMYSVYNHGVHIRYNYLHDFKAAGCGVYLDDMAFSHYAYYNIVDTSTATTDKAKSFLYTSSGRYNVFFGNILVGREIDRINESTLFIPGTRFDGHFTERMKEYTELLPQKYILTKFYARFPELESYYNMMKQYVNDIKQPGYTINENEINLRTPQNNIVANNVVLGSKVFFNQDILEYKNPLTNQYSTSSDLIENNYVDMDINSVLADYRNGDFSIRSEALAKVTAAIPNFKPLSAESAGLTYELVK